MTQQTTVKVTTTVRRTSTTTRISFSPAMLSLMDEDDELLVSLMQQHGVDVGQVKFDEFAQVVRAFSA